VFDTDKEWYKSAAIGIALGDIISLVIGFILLVNMLPTAMTQFYAQGTGTWLIGTANDTATVAIWRLMPLMGVLAGFVLIALPVLKRL
jgi:hypothetical protein